MTNNKKKEKEIEKYIKTLQISREEAEQLWEDDNSNKLTIEQKELEQKAKKDIKNYTQSEKSHNKGKKKERKINTIKLNILQQIQFFVGGKIEKETAIHFEKEGKQYTLKLIEHRKSKK